MRLGQGTATCQRDTGELGKASIKADDLTTPGSRRRSDD